jgi:hypothetical protein
MEHWTWRMVLTHIVILFQTLAQAHCWMLRKVYQLLDIISLDYLVGILCFLVKIAPLIATITRSVMIVTTTPLVILVTVIP